MANLNEQKETLASRDGENISPWQQGVDFEDKPGVTETQTYDVLIVGAGITGLSTALLLQKAGKICIVADAYEPGFGTTGGTSAHINTFADTTYKEAGSAFGEDGAQLFADAVNAGFDLIKTNIKRYQIDCDYEDKTGYLFAETDDEVKQLDDVYEGLQQVKVPARYEQHVPTPVKFKKALKLDGQAQFHPLKYLQAIQQEFLKLGGVVQNYTLITELEKNDDVFTASYDEGKIQAKAVVYATHMPPGLNVFNFRCAPYRSYVMGITLSDDNYPESVIYDMQEPYHYYRTHIIDGQKYLIAGGNDHKTGHDDPEAAFADLEKYLKQYYKIDKVVYKWSSQYYIPVDGLPYIGQMPEMWDGVYCATGYNGNGMMLGSAAAETISDLILTGDSKYKPIFNPGRIKPIDGFTEFVKENADVAWRFLADRFKIKEEDSLRSLQKDSGKVLEIDGKKIAAYRDETGKLHALSPVCTHAKCIVNWNQTERSWDCPCHGARYDINGEVLTGPARTELEQIDIDDAI